ncbi:hypothetical protein ABID76_005000 [Burkholderia ambifaria]
MLFSPYCCWKRSKRLSIRRSSNVTSVTRAARRPVAQPREHPVDLRAGALDHRLDTAVLEIRDPTAQLQRMRLAHRRVTEADALHDAAHPHVVGLDPFVQFITAHRVALPLHSSPAL